MKHEIGKREDVSGEPIYIICTDRMQAEGKNAPEDITSTVSPVYL